MDYLIIGGGASGMVSAINLSKKGYKVTIIEKNNTLGKKLLRTGSGRCNYFNDDFNETKYYSEEKNEITRFINEENKNYVIKLLNNYAIMYIYRDRVMECSGDSRIIYMEANKQNKPNKIYTGKR